MVVDRRQALVTAAAAVLERAGGEDITVQEVADQAGQSLRTLYQHFRSKDDLLLAVFEEAMGIYAAMLTDAIAGLSAPLDRLGGAILAAVRIPEVGESGIARGLVRLRLTLSESQPERLAAVQASVTDLVRDLVVAAADDGTITAVDAEGTTFMVLSLNATFITAQALGNDTGVDRPGVLAFATFCLRGLGAEVDDRWFERIDRKLRLPQPTSLPG